jgi:hypothetical protein
MTMGWFDKKPKTGKYHGSYQESKSWGGLYSAEVKRQSDSTVKREVREAVRRDLMTARERTVQAGDKILTKKKAVYNSIGPTLRVNSNALGRLKQLGKGRF